MKLFTRLFGRRYLVKEFVDCKEKELPKDMDIKNYYTVSLPCKNCYKDLTVYIKKGIYLKYIKEEIICDNCGCRLGKE